MDTAPFDEWSADVAAYFTWGPGYTTGLYILTALGFALFVASLVGFIMLERKKLDDQAAKLRAGQDPQPRATVGS